MVELIITDGWVVACMTCHQQLGTEVDTYKQAEKMAKTHFAPGDKPHDGHTITFTPTKLVRKKK
jgi:hypothetical protein